MRKKNMELTDEKIWLFGVVTSCPAGNQPLDSCTLKGIRQLPKKEQLSLIIQLDKKEVDTLIVAHKRCLLRRLQ